MLHHLLAQGRVEEGMVVALAQRLASFHREAARGPRIGRYGRLQVIAQNWEENFSQTEPFIGTTITAQEHQRLQAYVWEFLKARRPLFLARVAGGYIRDCHGDVRAENICFTNGPCIFDCIEFNRRFRYCDVASEVAFLAMDLDFYGRSDLSQLLIRHYTEAAGDPDLPLLVDFYKCYRAYVRGKVESFKLAQPEVSAEEKARAREVARRHFELALAYAEATPRPLLAITCGLVGTGKSTLAQALARELPLTLLTSDVVRKELAGLSPEERRLEPFGRGIYSPAFTRRTYTALLRRAGDLLSRGRSVILDASFARRQQRERARRLARALAASFLCLECRAPAEEVQRRLAERLARGKGPSDARWEIYQEQRRRFQPVTELPPQEHLIIDTQAPPQVWIDAARRHLALLLGSKRP